MAFDEFTLSHIEGQFLLRYSNAKIPADGKVGQETFEPSVVSNGNDQIVLVRRDLRSYSPILLRDRKPCFGDADNWKKEEKKEGPVYNMIDPDREITLKMSDDSITGILWMLALALDQKSGVTASNAEIDELVWPLAAKFGWVPELRRMFNIDRAKAKMFIRHKVDPSPQKDSK